MSLKVKLLLSAWCAAWATLQPVQVNAAMPASLEAVDRGAADAQQRITITVHLALPDNTGFQKTVAALYDRASPSFHHWLTDAELQKFAPSAAQREAVRKTLEASGLSILSVDKNGFSIRASGSLADVARAFNTQFHNFELRGEVFRRNVTPAILTGSAAAYVHSVAGLESHVIHPMLTRAKNLKTGAVLGNIALKKGELAGGLAKYITDKSLTPAQSFTFTGAKSFPTATYTGIVYDSDGSLVPDFSPKQLEEVYGLPAAYKKGLDGTGQTIVLLEGFDYPTIESDANAAAKLTGLPRLTDTNFGIVYPEGLPNPEAGIEEGWNIEIALDVQSSHAIAPGANIVVVATNGQDSEDFQYSMQYIIDNNIGSSVSDSWEEDLDLVAGPAEQQSFEDILVVAAAKGISFQFSTGDSGDNGVGSPLGAAGVPSVAPHATAVGGTAILNNVGTTGFTPVSWGEDFAYLAFGGAPLIPPEAIFGFGGGGGESTYWPKPAWQQALPGLGRQTPDVSALADPYTGFPLVVTDGGQRLFEPGWGGTSLASPIFTAFWVIAQQAAGGPLGQASPLLATLKTGLQDVIPHADPNDVTGVITKKTKTINYSTLDIFAPAVEQNTVFIGAIFANEGGLAIAFGTDSSLTATTGWDNATGYGTPHGLSFIDAVVAAAKP